MMPPGYVRPGDLVIVRSFATMYHDPNNNEFFDVIHNRCLAFIVSTKKFTTMVGNVGLIEGWFYVILDNNVSGWTKSQYIIERINV